MAARLFPLFLIGDLELAGRARGTWSYCDKGRVLWRAQRGRRIKEEEDEADWVEPCRALQLPGLAVSLTPP